MNKEIEIPEGYEARIEDNKVIIELKESEDERIRKSLINYVYCHGDAGDFTKKEFIAYLERQKECKSLPIDLSIEDVETIKTALRESGLEFTANQKVYDKLEKVPASAYYLSTVGRSELYPDGRVERHIIGYLEKPKEQKPTEWSEEDEKRFDSCMGRLLTPDGEPTINSSWFEDHCSKHHHWKPSEEQMKALEDAFRKDGGNEYRKVINSLYCDLQKLL